MQRILFRYRKDTSASTLSHNDLRAVFIGAATQANLPVGENRRTIVMGPPLPAGATSEAELAVIELMTPRDPSEVCRLLNRHLVPGVHLEQAWIAPAGGDEETPSALDEAVYDVLWRDAPSPDEITPRIRQFLAASEVQFTRVREKKTQQFNARALVRELALLGHRDHVLRLRMVLAVGPQGSVRPEEVLTILGYSPSPATIQVHRVALQRSAWRHASGPRCRTCWQRV